MQISSVRALVVVAAVFMCGVGEATPDKDKSQLIALDRAMQRSVVDRDAKAFANFLTDDYVLVSASGKIVKKGDVVAEITDPQVHYETNESSDVSVRVEGDTGLVVATLHQKGTDHGKAFEYRLRYTDTWVRQGANWRNISAHACRLPLQ